MEDIVMNVVGYGSIALLVVYAALVSTDDGIF